jgi:hypothetical protein
MVGFYNKEEGDGGGLGGQGCYHATDDKMDHGVISSGGDAAVGSASEELVLMKKK